MKQCGGKIVLTVTLAQKMSLNDPWRGEGEGIPIPEEGLQDSTMEADMMHGCSMCLSGSSPRFHWGKTGQG